MAVIGATKSRSQVPANVLSFNQTNLSGSQYLTLFTAPFLKNSLTATGVFTNREGDHKCRTNRY